MIFLRKFKVTFWGFLFHSLSIWIDGNFGLEIDQLEFDKIIEFIDLLSQMITMKLYFGHSSIFFKLLMRQKYNLAK